MVRDGEPIVAGGDRPILLQAVDQPLGRAALAVGDAVEVALLGSSARLGMELLPNRLEAAELPTRRCQMVSSRPGLVACLPTGTCRPSLGRSARRLESRSVSSTTCSLESGRDTKPWWWSGSIDQGARRLALVGYGAHRAARAPTRGDRSGARPPTRTPDTCCRTSLSSSVIPVE